MKFSSCRIRPRIASKTYSGSGPVSLATSSAASRGSIRGPISRSTRPSRWLAATSPAESATLVPDGEDIRAQIDILQEWVDGGPSLDYVAVNPKPDAATVIADLPHWFDHYNALHPHRALGYRSPREFIASRANKNQGGDRVR